MVPTSLSERHLDDAGAVRASKSLARVERAFRSLKTSGLQVRPIFHWKASRVRAGGRITWNRTCGSGSGRCCSATKTAMMDSTLHQLDKSMTVSLRETSRSVSGGLLCKQCGAATTLAVWHESPHSIIGGNNIRVGRLSKF